MTQIAISQIFKKGGDTERKFYTVTLKAKGTIPADTPYFRIEGNCFVGRKDIDKTNVSFACNVAGALSMIHGTYRTKSEESNLDSFVLIPCELATKIFYNSEYLSAETAEHYTNEIQVEPLNL